jgi:LysM repeat protein
MTFFPKTFLKSVAICTLFATTFCTPSSLFAQTGAMTKPQYIAKYKEIAISEMERSGVPASITLAQGIVESSAGNSKLAKEANNHFGIKCGAKWTGPVYYIEDDDYDADGNLMKSCFRKYPRAEESYLDHTDFLTTGKRYETLFKLQTTDYKGWASGLKSAGYATNPKYADILIKCVEDHKLNQYDKIVDKNSPIVSADGKTIRNPFVNKKSETGIFKNNGLKVVIAQKNETALEIASRYNVPYDRFLKYNDLKPNDPLIETQYLYLQKKRNSFFGKKELHPVAEGETMYMISQLYGIKLKTLYCRNRMKAPQEPATNVRLKLRGRAKKTPQLLPLNPSATPPVKTDDKVKTADNTEKAPKDAKKDSKKDKKEVAKKAGKTTPSADASYGRVMDLMEEMLKIQSKKMPDTKETAGAPSLPPSQDALKDAAKDTPKAPTTPPVKVGTGGWVQVADDAKPHAPKPPTPVLPKAPKGNGNTSKPAPPVSTAPVEVYVPATPPKRPTVPNYEQSKNPTKPEVKTPAKPEIKKPAAVMPNTSSASAPAGSYLVEEGDTLFSVAKKHGLTVPQLKALNNLDGDAISLGQILKIK